MKSFYHHFIKSWRLSWEERWRETQWGGRERRGKKDEGERERGRREWGSKNYTCSENLESLDLKSGVINYKQYLFNDV